MAPRAPVKEIAEFKIFISLMSENFVHWAWVPHPWIPQWSADLFRMTTHALCFVVQQFCDETPLCRVGR